MNNEGIIPDDILDKVDKKEVRIMKEDGTYDYIMGYEIKVSPKDYDFKNNKYKRAIINDEIIEFE